ncbi:MAG TPA: hypothetical protein VGA47_11120 [Candidatus Dormibacteraeota bacterium]
MIHARGGMYIFLKALHVITMFAAVTLLMGEALFLCLATWRRDVRALSALHRMAPNLSLTAVGAALFLVGVVLGFILAATGHLNFLAGWLIAAYVLVALILLNNVSPFVQRLRPLVREAVEAEAGRRPVEEVVRSMDRVRTGLFVAVAINTVIFVSVIADMILKPF